MSLLGRLKNIFTSNTNSNNDNKKRQKHSYIKFDADPNEIWEIVGELGDGAFGKVYKARHKVQQIFAALKQVDINDETELDDYSVEIDILNQCRHKNIVGLHEAFFFGGKLWMFIEFCGGGALDGIMLELEKPLTEAQIRYVCREMCEALDFLHQHFVIHRDLKAGNVLLTCDGEVKLADFGVSARNSSYRQKRDTFIGTPYWMAPEVILCETIKDSPYDFKADIWSFGVTLIEFAQIEPPNHEMHPMRVLVKIQKSDPPTLNYPSRWSKEFNDFIAKCLVRDPDQRPTTGDLLQHPFIRDVKDNHAIMELVSEANAEIILEEKDLDDDLDEGIDLDGRSGATTDIDSDSVSNASGSNIGKPNDAEEDSISDSSPAAGDAGKVSLPAIVVGVIEEDTSPSKESLPVPAAAAAAVDEKKSKAAEPREGTPTEIDSPEGEEPVILRKKKPPAAVETNKSPSSEEATDGTTGQKKYRTLTKTRKYLVNGEVVMSKVSKIIVPGSSADKKQQEHELWKADLRELKLLHKQEKKLLQDMDLKSLAAIDEQNRKFEQDSAIFLRNAENSLEQLTKQHKQQMDKMIVSHATEMKNMQKKTRQEQDKDLRSFNESLKQELKLLKQEVDLMPKDVRKDTFQQRKKEKEIEHAEKERKFIELQKENLIRTLKRVEDQQKDQIALAERQFLQLKQQTIRAREMSLWEAEVSQLKDRYRLNVQQLDSKFMLKKQLMMTRHAKELEQVQRINASKEDELLQCHLLENKRLPKIMKYEGKTRALMFKQSLRISVVGITAEQEKERIKQFEEVEKKRLKEEEARLRKKHKRQMDELKAKNEAVVKELEQVHAEKRKMLDDNEVQKRKELEDQFQTDLNNVVMAQIPKKEALEAAFIQEMADNEKFYANGTSVDQDSGKNVKSGVSHIISPNIGQVSATSTAKPQARFTPESGKKLATTQAPQKMTVPAVTSSKTSAEPVHVSIAKAPEEKLPVPIAKATEEKLTAPTAKASEGKLPASVSKEPEEKVPVPIAKVLAERLPAPISKEPESNLPVPDVKAPEEKVLVSVTKTTEEKSPAPISKEPEVKPVPNVKAPEEKEPFPVAKVPEEKLPAPVAKEPEENLPIPDAKAPEEKLPAPVAKEPDENLPIPDAKAPEEKLPVPDAKAPEEKLPAPVAKEPDENLPIPDAKAPEEKVLTCVEDSSVTVGAPVSGSSVVGPLDGPFVGDPSVCSPCVGISAAPAVSEVSEENKDTTSLVTAIPEDRATCIVAVTADETQPTDSCVYESKISEPIVPCPTSYNATALPSLPQHQEISTVVSTEQTSDTHLNVAVEELLQTDAKAVVTGALPVHDASSQDKGLIKEMGRPTDEWVSGKENPSPVGIDIKIPDSSVPTLEEAKEEELPIIPSSTISLSSASAESSVENYFIADVSGSQGQDKSAVEESAGAFQCQTGMSPSSPIDLAQAVIAAGPDAEVPATDLPDEGCSRDYADLEVSDAHWEKSDGKLCETSYGGHEMRELSAERSETQREASDKAHLSSCSHPEISDATNECSDPHEEESSSVQEQIESDHENCEIAHESRAEKSKEAVEHTVVILHEESDTSREVCDSPDDKKESPDEKNSSLHGRCEKSDGERVVDLSLDKKYDESCDHSDPQEEGSSSYKTGNGERVVDLSLDKNYDESCDHSDPQDQQHVSSSHHRDNGDNLLECPESHHARADALHDDKETGSSSIPLTSLDEVSGASEEQEGRLHEKSESSDEKNIKSLENTDSELLDKNESMSEEKSESPC